ncbi:mannosyltransferase putative-domain-containing protein, partial [Obelidium mucronatum]
LTALQSKSKRLSNTLYPWAFSKRFTDISRLVRSFQEDYGIVFSVGNAGFKSALLMILHIRENLGCDLPVEVFYNGEKDLQLSSIESLSLIQGVAVKNLQDYFTIAHDRNYHSKPFAILASSFKKVFYLDDDVVLFHSPKTMFNESRIFKTYGSLFFKGPSYTAGNSQWARWFLKSPSITANTTRFFRGISKDEVDASVMLFDKSRLSIVHALLTTCHLNLKDVRESGLDKQLPGDKETYWLALELLRIPYKLSPYNAGAAGTLQILDSGRVVPTSVCGPLAHMNENRK